jgi:ribosomal protein L11 methyltransferase
MVWLQFSVEVPANQVDAVSEAFTAINALSITVLDAGDEPLLEPAPGETPLWSMTRIVALFEGNENAAKIKQQFNTAFSGPLPDILVERLEDRDWSSTWRDTFGQMCFGERLWVCPVGESPPDTEAIIVHLDPGLAFGTGTHTTTALCLEWLDAHPPVNQQVVDYGCGSGILAIAACKLGAKKAFAVDIDPQALQATRENASRNGINAGLKVLLPGELDADPVDLIIANILARPLIELSAELANNVASGGTILLTGILAEQAEAVMLAYTPCFDFVMPVVRENWVLLEGVRKVA